MGPGAAQEVFQPTSNDQLKLTDYLTVDQHVGVFYSYLRESKALGSRLLTPNAKTTIFAPTNHAIMSMDRLPHKGPAGEDEDFQTLDEEKARAEYLEKWVSRYLVDAPSVDLNAESVETLVENNPIMIKVLKSSNGAGQPDLDSVQLGPAPQGAEPVKITERLEAADGVLYKLDGVLTLEQ